MSQSVSTVRARAHRGSSLRGKNLVTARGRKLSSCCGGKLNNSMLQSVASGHLRRLSFSPLAQSRTQGVYQRVWSRYNADIDQSSSFPLKNSPETLISREEKVDVVRHLGASRRVLVLCFVWAHLEVQFFRSEIKGADLADAVLFGSPVVLFVHRYLVR
jgi:hypothetical protein